MYQGEDKILEFVNFKKHASIEEIAKGTDLNLDHVRKVVEDLKQRAVMRTEEKSAVFDKLTEEGEKLSKTELYEVSLFNKVYSSENHSILISQLNEIDKKLGLANAKKMGFISIENGKIIPTKTPDEVKEYAVSVASTMSCILKSNKADNQETAQMLFDRKLAERTFRKNILVYPTGNKLEASLGFDINSPSSDALVGKNHPLTKMMKKIKSTFLNLGFAEMESQFIESSFWNFDALFQPQDHPARELADTFYLNGEVELPDSKLVGAIKKSHEKNWKYSWQENVAKKMLLRTHTTATSARYLEKLRGNSEPKKYFAIGRVFRNEATDYSHLAEFHQVEGIIVWEKATFRHLLGILKEFYKRLGFEKIRFRPSYFPYTEPSLEIEIFYEPKNTWLELGGAGIFRPEVSIPLCNKYPVLAWGISLERPLMLAMGIKDVRTIYKNDMDFLKSARI
ncbi:MAG: phenylalanine--tRNA ligase subunit alpha [Candidatus Micrarchaeota archaeon]